MEIFEAYTQLPTSAHFKCRFSLSTLEAFEMESWIQSLAFPYRASSKLPSSVGIELILRKLYKFQYVWSILVLLEIPIAFFRIKIAINWSVSQMYDFDSIFSMPTTLNLKFNFLKGSTITMIYQKHYSQKLKRVSWLVFFLSQSQRN